jgi:hypothetical protein
MSKISFFVVAAGLLIACMGVWLAATGSYASDFNVEDDSRGYLPAGNRLPSLPGVARGHQHPAEDAELHHKFYSTWMMPSERKQSCCNQRDCYPTEVKNFGGTWFAKRREDGAWIPIPENKLEQNQADPRESP